MRSNIGFDGEQIGNESIPCLEILLPFAILSPMNVV